MYVYVAERRLRLGRNHPTHPGHHTLITFDVVARNKPQAEAMAELESEKALGRYGKYAGSSWIGKPIIRHRGRWGEGAK